MNLMHNLRTVIEWGFAFGSNDVRRAQTSQLKVFDLLRLSFSWDRNCWTIHIHFALFVIHIGRRRSVERVNTMT